MLPTRWLFLMALGAFSVTTRALHAQTVATETSGTGLPPQPPLTTGGHGGVQPVQYAAAPAPEKGTGPLNAKGPVPFSGADRWHLFPVLRSTPRMGWFALPGSGPGYYSLWDGVRGIERDKAPANPYGNPFYDNDFRHLDKPDAPEKGTGPFAFRGPVPFSGDAVFEDWADRVKRRHHPPRPPPLEGGDGGGWVITFGGEERLRFVNETDSRLSFDNNRFQLLRSRVYGDAWYQDRFRVFAEFIDASIFNNDLAPLRTDEDHSDFFNLFVDWKLFDLANGPVYFRGGQQELLYGSQRLVSPPDWSNTRRTFRGIKGFYRGDQWDADIFWVRPVVPQPGQFDDADNSQDFAGAWLTYRPVKGQAVDLYYLMRYQAKPVTGFNKVKGDQVTHTVGTRYAGAYPSDPPLPKGGPGGVWLWDFEIMGQLGDYANQDVSALALTIGLGYSFACLPLEPTFWIYNDFASGTQRPGATSERHTFNQLFPSGHSYFGYLDQVGRQNIDDINLQFSVRPTKWVTSLLQAHFFYLDSARDALYNTQSNVVRQDPTGQSGHHVGNEIDALTTFRLSAHHEFSIGYSKLFAGEFLRRTGPAVSPELFYFQYYFRW